MIDRFHKGVSGGSQSGDQSVVSLPSHRATPLEAVVTRTVLAVVLLLVTTLIVYLGRDGYVDAARPHQPLNLLASFYYSAVTLSTTGYGDIVPVTATARLVNTLVLTPIRVVFLILLIGTTLEVLAERTRAIWRVSRWRSSMTAHTVVVGYGTKGRSAVRTLREAGVPTAAIVAVDILPPVVAEANRAGLAAVTGDGTRREVLIQAELPTAARLVIAVDQDSAAVLIALTARQLSPAVVVTAAVREAENEPLLRQSGADHVVVSSDAAGRLLGLATAEPGAGLVLADLLNRVRGLDLTERAAGPADVGRPASEVCAGVVALLRDRRVLALDDPGARAVQKGDRLIVMSAALTASGQR